MGEGWRTLTYADLRPGDVIRMDEDGPEELVDLAIEAGGHCQRTVGYVGPESRALTEGDKP